MWQIEGENKMKPHVSLWHKGWKAAPISCTIPKLHEPTPPTKPTVDNARYRQCKVQTVRGTGSAGHRQCKVQAVQGTDSARHRQCKVQME